MYISLCFFFLNGGETPPDVRHTTQVLGVGSERPNKRVETSHNSLPRVVRGETTSGYFGGRKLVGFESHASTVNVRNSGVHS